MTETDLYADLATADRTLRALTGNPDIGLDMTSLSTAVTSLLDSYTRAARLASGPVPTRFYDAYHDAKLTAEHLLPYAHRVIVSTHPGAPAWDSLDDATRSRLILLRIAA